MDPNADLNNQSIILTYVSSKTLVCFWREEIDWNQCIRLLGYHIKRVDQQHITTERGYFMCMGIQMYNIVERTPVGCLNKTVTGLNYSWDRERMKRERQRGWAIKDKCKCS